MNDEPIFAFPCDVCGSSDAEPIPVVPLYSGGRDLHTCRQCGFVYAHLRRSDEAIKRDWADNMFDGNFDVEQTDRTGFTGYTAKVPAVVARLTYALENFDAEIGFADTAVCDLGAGEGDFLTMLSERKRPRSVFGIEPSANNTRLLKQICIDSFTGGIEDFAASDDRDRSFDVVTLNWTLENTQNARRVMQLVNSLLPVGGYVQVATGSRILVPFKKPLHYYFNPRNPLDLHAFHFSANSLPGLMISTGFEPLRVNRCIDTDYLCVIGRKHDGSKKLEMQRDDYAEVIDFFARWHRETEDYYR
jgi:hypothetical protein